MPLIFSTFVVLNEDKFIDCKEEHPLNIELIILTLVLRSEERRVGKECRL